MIDGGAIGKRLRVEIRELRARGAVRPPSKTMPAMPREIAMRVCDPSGRR